MKELFAMVDQDLKANGQWCGKLGVGKEWVLGDEVSSIPRIRGVFSRVERHTRHTGNRTQVTYTYELWIVDDRRERQITFLKSEHELEEAMDCLRRRAPAAVFGVYDSKEYQDLVYTKDDMQQYAQERAYQQRKAQQDEQVRQEQERLAQNQVLTLPDGSVTSRITWDTIYQLLRQPDQKGETVPFQLVPSVPFQGQGHTFSRLACLAGGVVQPTRILLEEYSGRPVCPASTPGPGMSPLVRRRRFCEDGYGGRSLPWRAGRKWSGSAAPGSNCWSVGKGGLPPLRPSPTETGPGF